MRKKDSSLVKELLFWVLAMVMMIPIFIIIFNAFKTQNESMNMALSPPKVLHFENFKEVWEKGNILTALKNSLIMSIVSVAVSVFCSSLCAYVLCRNKTRINKFLYIYFAMGLMFPVSMVAIVKVLRVAGLYNTYAGTILVFIALILPLSIFLYYGFISGIPQELDEAAIIDGAGAVTIFFKIIFPLLKPATVTVVMINFLNVWNDFSVPLYTLPDPNKAVIVQQAYNFYGTFTASWNLVSVTILMAIAPVLVVYLIGQRYIISGMAAGAVKG